MKRIAAASIVLLSLAAVPAAEATHCSGSTVPPPEYSNGTKPPIVLGYQVITGLPSAAWIGAHYADGYFFIDVSNPTRPTWRSFNPIWPGYSDIRIVGGASPFVCVHGKPMSPWPMQSTADGCLVVGTSAGPCSFRGGTRIGTQSVPPVPATNPSVDLLGGYVAAAPSWAIYRAQGNGSTILFGSALTSPPGGLVTFGAGVEYFVCVGSVNTSLPPASACSPGPGAVVAMHP